MLRSAVWPLLLLSIFCNAPYKAATSRTHRQAAIIKSAQADVTEFRMANLHQKLQTMPLGPEREYFAGVFANRAWHITNSIHLFKQALPKIRAAHPGEAAIALRLLADDYDKTFQYANAARTYDDLLRHFSTHLRPEELQNTKDDASVARLLIHSPPQTIHWSGPVRLKTVRNPLRLRQAKLTVNGVRQQWILDTGANESVVSRSFAKKLKLKLLPGHGQTQGITGLENPLQVAILPVLHLQGATLHNVVLLVFADSNLQIRGPGRTYQINAILGYPVFQALGKITFTHDGWVEAGTAAQNGITHTRMYMQLLNPVIECGVQGHQLPFTLDTGATSTVLSHRFYHLFRSEVPSWKSMENELSGAGGVVKRKAFLIPKLRVQVGKETAVIRNIPVFPPKAHAHQELYGNLGEDLVAGFQSFTLDFKKMTFSLGSPMAQGKKRSSAQHP